MKILDPVPSGLPRNKPPSKNGFLLSNVKKLSLNRNCASLTWADAGVLPVFLRFFHDEQFGALL